MLKANLFYFFFILIVNYTYAQSGSYNCTNGATVEVEVLSLSPLGDGSQCGVEVEHTATIYNNSQKDNYTVLGNPSYNSNIYTGNYGGPPFPSTTSTIATININQSCNNLTGAALELRIGDLTGPAECSSQPLGNTVPVELINFTSATTENTVQLFWETGTEFNNESFLIQRSKDAQTYETVGVVKGSGNSTKLQNYDFTDRNPLYNLSFYRLIQLDFDGTENTHKLIAVKFKGSEGTLDFKISPSIVQSQLTVELNQEVSDRPIIYISTMLGQKLLQLPFTNGATQTLIDVSNLPKGQYVLTIEAESSNTSRKFIKL